MSASFERWAEQFDARVEARSERITAEREEMRGDRWSRWFGRSRLGRNVFSCRVSWLQGDLRREGWPEDARSMLMGPTHLSVAFADGGWFSRIQSWSFGIGGLHGEWVVGFGALRYVCDLLGLVPPRRLKGETAVPDLGLLRAEIERQKAEDGDLLAERARLLLTPESQYSYLPEAVFAGLGIRRPRFGLDEADTAVMLDVGSWAFLARVGGVGEMAGPGAAPDAGEGGEA